MEAETNPQQPTTTTMIRSSDPDLTIIVGQGEQQEIYEYHSPIIAMHSQYIDNMLATPVREQETRTISFPDIDSTDWESMIGYLQPGALPPQTLDQVRVVLPFYDKYEFQSGLAICDRMLAAFDFDVGANLDQCMVAVEMVYEYAHRFSVSKANAAACVRTVFASHAVMFCLDKEHICRLVPALRADESLWTLAVEKALHPFDANLVDSEMYLASPLFPEVLDRSIQALVNECALHKMHTSIEVTGAGAVEANGTYVYEEQGSYWWYAKRASPPSHQASHFIEYCRMRNTGLPVWAIFRARGPPHRHGIPAPADDRSILYTFVECPETW